MKFIPMSYKISINGYFGDEVRVIGGYAADTPHRLCVHKTKSKWECDDYDTGRRVGVALSNRQECVENAVHTIRQNGAERYAYAQNAALKRLKKAGLL